MTKPSHYMTPAEFLEQMLRAMKRIGTDVDVPMHPEDIEIMLTAFMQAYAIGMVDAVPLGYNRGQS